MHTCMMGINELRASVSIISAFQHVFLMQLSYM